MSDNLKVNEFRVSNTLFLFIHQYNKKIHLFILIKNNKNYSKKKNCIKNIKKMTEHIFNKSRIVSNKIINYMLKLVIIKKIWQRHQNAEKPTRPKQATDKISIKINKATNLCWQFYRPIKGILVNHKDWKNTIKKIRKRSGGGRFYCKRDKLFWRLTCDQ